MAEAKDDTVAIDLADGTPANDSVVVDVPDGTPNAGDSRPKGFLARFRKPKPSDDSGDSSDDEKEDQVKPVNYTALFRYADPLDKLYIFAGAVSAAGHGVLLPIFTIFLGDIFNSFSLEPGEELDPDAAEEGFVNSVGGTARKLLILGAVALVLSFFQVYCFMRSAQRQCARIRRMAVHSVLSQDMSWYDSIDPGELTSRVAGDVDLMQAGMGDKVGSVIQFMSMFLAGFAVGFAFGWKMTLVILAVTPIIAISGGLMAKVSAEATTEGQENYAKAGGIADEVLSLIRIVTAFGGQKKEQGRYFGALDDAYKFGVKRAHLTGLSLGFTFLVIFSVYGLAFWFGSREVRAGRMEPGYVTTVFFSVIIGAMALGQGAPAFQSFTTARGAAPKVFQVIERESEIDPFGAEGDAPMKGFVGDIEFRDVDFRYPSRPEVQILHKMCLGVRPGTTMALVGPSGCGKSTTIQLLERFYDPEAGQVLLDGKDIREYNVRWLRSQIGFVSQMPTLFAGTICDNIAFGAPLDPPADGSGSPVDWSRRQVTQEEVEAAAKVANAHKFIMKLPDKYNTVIGERGAMLSGGQKQRIAIARAIVRDPKILLLDEATSALDAASEKVVQDALEKASKGRTTMVIAHRLSTIKNADVIGVVSDGKIVETGTHSELMAANGVYHNLVQLQNIKASEEEEVAGKTLDDLHDVADEIPKDDPAQTSLVDTSFKEGEEESSEEEVDSKSISRAIRCNADQWPLIVIGCLGAGVSGSSFVIMSVVFSEVITELIEPGRPGSRGVNFWSSMFVVLGAVAFVATYLQQALLGMTGERLTRKLRGQSFVALLRQEIGFFDERENSVGALTTRLSTEASQVKGLTGETMGIFASVSITLLVGIIVAFTGCWKVALVVLAMMPAVAVGGFIQIKMMTGFDTEGKKQYAKAGTIASEAVDNIRAVASCGIEPYFVDRYASELNLPLQQGKKTATVAGVAFGFSEFFTFAVFAVAYWYGSRLIDDGSCNLLGVNKALNGLIFGAMTLGNVAAFMPDVASARIASAKIFRLLDRESKIDPTAEEGAREDIKGRITFNEVGFRYPTREEVRVLKKLSVAVEPGKTLALVGESGCGKSTLVSLAERFYDATGGEILIDGVKLTDYNLQHLRSQMSIVMQEPDLFNMTIRENILYGALDRAEEVSDKEIEEAARNANAHDFIKELPDGYDTVVGQRGGQLSGGQRQRVAIARALIRDPKVLLLDEATSALDSKSESVVQEALDRARLGRTSIVIAHRLSTIQGADQIAVVADGKIAEIGTHDELMAKNELYAGLVRHQTMTNEGGSD